jgi:hypothetical protein
MLNPRLLALACTLPLIVGACEEAAPVDPETKLFHQDAGVDFSIPTQVTHIGPTAVTCCLMANQGTAQVFYLANPKPGRTDAQGILHPSTGELHIATPFGVDYTLGQKVPAFGYGFSPDGTAAFFLTGASAQTFALNMIRLTQPDLKQPDVVTVIDQGLDDPPLAQQGFYTPSGSFLIVGSRAPGVMNTFDLHVVNVLTGKDVYQLDKGAFSYLELITLSDKMIFENSTASTTLGTPSVQGLYILDLNAAVGGGAQPTLIDTHTAQASLTADTQTLLYVRANGDLMLYDLKEGYYQKVASNVANFTLGPRRKGPITYTTTDLSLHVLSKLQPEVVATAPHSIDLFSPIVFSPDVLHLYYFQNVDSEDNYGDLYHIALPQVVVGVTAPPVGAGTLFERRVSTKDLYFTNDRLVYLHDISTTGDTGSMVSAALDGSDKQPMADGVATGLVQIGYPRPFQATLPPQQGFYNPGPLDMSSPPVPPLFANLTAAARDTSSAIKLVDSSRPVVGALSFGPVLGQPEVTLDPSVHAGAYGFSDDGYVLLYLGNAKYSTGSFNYVGSLQLFQTAFDVAPVTPTLDGVSELGPIVNRALFVNAPANATPGLYFVKY